MWGFGAPSSLPLATTVDHYDWGWGDPTPSSFDPDDNQDWGFGDVAPLAVAVTLVTSPTRLPDDGGEIITIEGAWSQQGPYHVRVESGGVKYPIGGFCHSAIPSKSSDCYTGRKPDGTPTNKLRFVLPAGLPLGTYDILIETAPQLVQQQTVTLASAFEVIYRGRTPNTYRIRSRLSRQLDADVRVLAVEPILDGSDTFPQGALEALTHSVGQRVQRLVSRPVTRLRQDLDPSDTTVHVESTLGFPTSGRVHIAGYLVTYTGRTNTTLTGASSAARGLTIPARETEVHLDVAALLPS